MARTRTPRIVRVAAILALVALTGREAAAVDANAVDRCHQDILHSMAAVTRGRTGGLARCLKSLQYDSCMETDLHTAIHEQELRKHVAGAASSCQAALASGATIADFGPASCGNEWDDCDVEVPAIATLDDLAECLVCQQRGFDFEIRHELGLPRPAPSDVDERRCTRRIARQVFHTVRKSLIDAADCAAGNTAPFACPVDATPASSFGAALATLPRAIDACGIDEGKAPGALAAFCDGSATDAAGLTGCFSGLALCIACHDVNSGLGETDDCAALSGFARCDGTF